MSDTPEQSAPQPKERSASYPAINLEKAITAAGKLKNNLGKGPFSRESAAQALGYKGLSGISASVVAALTQYGLLTRKGSTYSVSSIADSILTYRDEEERKSGISSAVKSPKLYASLISTYEGRSLPNMIDHILTRDYGIREKVALGVANTFEESLTFAGLLQNGVVRVSGDEEREYGTEDSDSQSSGTDDSPAPKKTPKVPGELLSVPITDTVWLSYPTELAFRLMTNAKVAKALKDLEKALDGDDSQDVENGNEST